VLGSVYSWTLLCRTAGSSSGTQCFKLSRWCRRGFSIHDATTTWIGDERGDGRWQWVVRGQGGLASGSWTSLPLALHWLPRYSSGSRLALLSNGPKSTLNSPAPCPGLSSVTQCLLASSPELLPTVLLYLCIWMGSTRSPQHTSFRDPGSSRPCASAEMHDSAPLLDGSPALSPTVHSLTDSHRARIAWARKSTKCDPNLLHLDTGKPLRGQAQLGPISQRPTLHSGSALCNTGGGSDGSWSGSNDLQRHSVLDAPM